MALENIISKLGSKEKKSEQFLAIEIGSENVTTAIWQVVDGQTQVVNIGTTEDWELGKESTEKLLAAIDASLEKTLEGIDPEPNKVIFGLQASWVEGQTIAKSQAKILKKITEKFEFEPIGFVVTTEAIVHWLKSQEGTPPTAILVRVSESEAQVILVKLGKVVGNQTVSRSEDIGADVEEGLARFKTEESFPARILIFNSTFDLESLKQDLLSYDWLEKLPFLHFPKVKILEKQVTIKAVAIAGGGEAAKSLGFEIVEEEEKKEEKEEETEAATPRELESSEEEQPEIKEDKLPDEILAADEIGFKEGTDVAEEPKKEEKKEPSPPEEQIEGKVQKGPEEEPKAPGWVAGVVASISKLTRIPSIPKPQIGLSTLLASRLRLTIAIVVGFFAVMAGIMIYGYWTIPKAKLVLYVKAKTLDKELTITIDPELSLVNAPENRIPGKTVEIEVEGGKEKETSGTRLVGEKATGEVTIYNKTSAVKSFPSGTVLVGTNNLTFTLDSQTSVASASSQESDEAITTMYGKTKAAVTAGAIGTQYNLPKDTDFTFKSFSAASYNAKTENELTGGTSREVQAISQEDINDLISELEAELKSQAASDLESQEGAGWKVLVDGAHIETLTKTISGEVDDEAENVSARFRLKISSLAYSEQDFSRIIDDSISEAIPADFELKHEESSTQVREVEYQNGLAKVKILYKAVLAPKIDEQEIRENLKGRYPRLVEDYLESLPNFSKAEIEITPAALPARLKTFPRNAQNITIEIRVEGS